MPLIDTTKLANLQALSLTERVDKCEYFKITWDTGVVNYYGGAAWQDEAPFTGIGLTIEARIIYPNPKDPFTPFEINPDLRTENIELTFDDIDKAITAKFQQYGSGVKAEMYRYYPDESVHVRCWYGQLQAPHVFGWKQIKTTLTNGYRSRELTVPSRRHPRECTAAVFAGLLPDADAVASSLCPYDRHVGGSVGNFISGSTPYASCPKLTIDDCVARLSNNGRYFGGFNTDAAAVVTDNRHFWLAVSRGNASNLKETVRVVFGTKTVRSLQLLLFRLERVGSDPKNSYVAGVWEVGEGPIQSIRNFAVNGIVTGMQHINFALGTRGQPPTNYAPNVSNFSSTAHVYARHAYVDLTNPSEFSPSSLTTECVVEGFKEVCVYTDDDPLTKSRQYSDDRVWCLLELYKNQKFGLGYAEAEFTILDFMTAATWGQQIVSHTATFPDGENRVYISRRTSFNAVIEGSGVGEQIENICRAGGISVPFQYDGKTTIRTFRAATAGELSAAKIFYDKGQNVNIAWLDDQPALELSQTPDNKLVNEVELRFEEAANNGAERPITVDDPNWKLKAGRQLGQDYLLAVPKRFVGTGITAFAEAVRIAYRLLKFGEFDEGGTDNNLRVKLTVPFEQALNLIRYEIIKIQSEILDGHTIGLGTTLETLSGTTPHPFRILRMKSVSGNKIEITAQAYNQTAYEAFETNSALPTSGHPCSVTNAGSFVVNGTYAYIGQLNLKPSYATGLNEINWDGSQWGIYANGVLYYKSTDNVDFPWLATWIVESPNGVEPIPYVLEGVYSGGLCELQLDTPTYNASTGILTVPILPC